MDENSARVGFSIYPSLIKEMDYWVKFEKRSRSDFIREAVRHYIRFIRRNYDRESAETR